MAVAEYCGNCDKRTLRSVGPCPECTPKNVASQTTDTQQTSTNLGSLRCTCGYRRTSGKGKVYTIPKQIMQCRKCGASFEVGIVDDKGPICHSCAVALALHE